MFRGHDYLNCKHQPNVCNFLLVLEVQILDTAFSSGVEKCESKTFSILSNTGVCISFHPLFHRHFIIHPALFILCFFSVRISCHLSSQLYLLLLHPLNHWPIYVWAMYSVSWVIYSSRSEWRSVLCYLLYVGLIRVSCVILTFILSSVTRVSMIRLCSVGIMRCLSRMLYSYCFDIIWCMLSCSSESVYKSRVIERVSGFPHMVCLSFIKFLMRNLMLEIDAVSVYIMSLSYAII